MSNFVRAYLSAAATAQGTLPPLLAHTARGALLVTRHKAVYHPETIAALASSRPAGMTAQDAEFFISGLLNVGQLYMNSLTGALRIAPLAKAYVGPRVQPPHPKEHASMVPPTVTCSTDAMALANRVPGRRKVARYVGKGADLAALSWGNAVSAVPYGYIALRSYPNTANANSGTTADERYWWLSTRRPWRGLISAMGGKEQGGYTQVRTEDWEGHIVGEAFAAEHTSHAAQLPRLAYLRDTKFLGQFAYDLMVQHELIMEITK